MRRCVLLSGSRMASHKYPNDFVFHGAAITPTVYPILVADPMLLKSSSRAVRSYSGDESGHLPLSAAKRKVTGAKPPDSG